MSIAIVADERRLAERAADVICEAVRAKPAARLGLPTGATPIATYAELRRRVEAGAADFSQAAIYAIDEFAGAGTSAPGTNRSFYAEHLGLGQRTLHCPDAAAVDAEAEIHAFAEAMRSGGGLDLCVLGIGTNGHIAFNEPASKRESRARVVDLAAASREAHAAAFGSLDAVPTRGMTLGVADVLEARRIVVLASGAGKAAIVRASIEGPHVAAVPASWLQSHTDVTWLLDAAAASALRPRIAGLYVIIDPEACRGRPVVDVARLALEGGARVIQWRDKRRPAAEQVDDALAIARICHDHGAIFIMNDYPELVAKTGADGVHLGQDDAPIDDVRPVVGGAIIGVSTNNADEARRAEASGADYVAIGAIFPTASKAVTRAASLERLREVNAAVHVPVVAIGGIDASNIAAVVEAGADAAAVISAVCGADDPRAAAAELAAVFGR